MSTDSAVAATLSLGMEARRLVRDIIDAVIPDAEVSVFGSRSTGRARPFSDLDLLFTRPARMNLAQRAESRSRFEASRPPNRVDLVDADALAPGGIAEWATAECRRL